MSVAETYATARECSSCQGADRWYWHKRRWIDDHRGNVDFVTAVTVYAICSQNATVAENDKNYLRAMRGEEVRHFGNVKRRVKLALAGDHEAALTYKAGRKIPSFRENLLYPWRKNVVTVDRHAGDIITGDRRVTKNTLARKDGYEEMARLYRQTARAWNVTANSVQARVWVHHLACEEAVA